MKKILIAEDDFYIRDIYTRIFVSSGYDTHTAVDGEEAINTITANDPFDMILLDILMPKMTGIEVLKKLRSLNAPHKDTPVYIISNLGQESVIEEAFQVGMTGYVIKSQVTPKQIVDEIDQFFISKGQAPQK